MNSEVRLPVLAVVLAVVCACGSSTRVDDPEDEPCCCASIVEGDIITGAPADSADACAAREQGSCVDQATVAARLTPHACCPEATADRCG